jgi:hypothetical protein
MDGRETNDGIFHLFEAIIDQPEVIDILEELILPRTRRRRNKLTSFEIGL